MPGTKELKNLPIFQLYDIENDPGEKHNLYEEKPEISRSLKILMTSIINNGRSTPGTKQNNDSPMNNNDWKQIKIFENSIN